MFAALRADERGTVTAEFAIVVPAVLAVLALVVGGIYLAAHRITLVSLAGEIARHEARGDVDIAQQSVAALGSRVEISRADEGALHCITLQSRPAKGPLAHVTVESRACAARTGEGDHQ